MYCVYLLRLSNSKKHFYIGSSSNLKRRIEEHKLGLVKSTKGREPKLIYYEAFCNRLIALKRERGLKTSGSVYNALMRRLGYK